MVGSAQTFGHLVGYNLIVQINIIPCPVLILGLLVNMLSNVYLCHTQLWKGNGL